MLRTAILCLGLLNAISTESRARASTNLAEYASTAARTKLDAAGHVRLALWCESHGMASERKEQLQQAVAADPSQATARGLLGQVADRGSWVPAETMPERIHGDQARWATLVEYNAKRAELRDTADAHWSLAVWCEQHGLPAEAAAHFTVVTRLAPERTEAWRKLGCRKYQGRWMNEKQIKAAEAKIEEQKGADRYWRPLVHEWWKAQLVDGRFGAESQPETTRIADPRAVPAILSVLCGADPRQQAAAVQLLSTIDAPEASRGLARIAALSQFRQVADAANVSLLKRDPHDYLDPLIGLLADPIRYDYERERRPGVRGYFETLIVEGKPIRDVRTAERRNRAIQQRNARVTSLLEAATHENLGQMPDAWRSWWSNEKGYTYTPTYPAHPQLYVTSRFVRCCFAAGTPVHTLLGCRPIETIQVGDRVLTQDPNTGALDYAAVVGTYHFPASPTLRLNLGGETIVTTGIHRFWRVGTGWAMARDLTAGDCVRVVGGIAPVIRVESEEKQPVFNLEVSGIHTLCVGNAGALVHDNGVIETVAVPFDAAPASLADLAAPSPYRAE
jgi:hypothetical protein